MLERINNGLYGADVFLDILRHFEEFSEKDEHPPDIRFSYEINPPEILTLRRKFLIDETLDSIRKSTRYPEEFEKTVCLMKWVSDRLIGDGSAVPISPINAESILDRTGSVGLRSNCYMYAVVLNELYLGYGFRSRMVRCMPMDLDFNDCHCVVCVFIEALNKWVLMDPANRTFFLDEKKVPMSLSEVRRALLGGSRIIVPFMPKKALIGLKEYYIKNMVHFECFLHSCFDQENLTTDRTMVHLRPVNYFGRNTETMFKGGKIKHVFTSDEDWFWET